MKRIFVFALACSLTVLVQGQYKKAGGYFGKSGRTYGFGGIAHMMNDQKGTPFAAYISIGRDRDEKRWFSWSGFSFIPPMKFSYPTLAAYTNSDYVDPVTITGKTRWGIFYDANAGIFLHQVKNTEAKFKPYISFGFNAQLLGSVNKTSTNRYDFAVSYYSFQREPSFSTVGFGAKIGAGFIYMLNEKMGLKTDFGYNKFTNFSYDEPGPGLNPEHFFSYVSNPYLSVGLQFRVLGND